MNIPDQTESLDRRQQRTRRLLKAALISLILERGYDDLTIQDITDRADVRRATFYLHYATKDELLAQVLAAMFDELVAQIGPWWRRLARPLRRATRWRARPVWNHSSPCLNMLRPIETFTVLC